MPPAAVYRNGKRSFCMAQQQKSAIETAAVLLGRHACTVAELRRKLFHKECFSAEEIETAVARLQEMGYLSDRRYAEDYVSILRSKGYGDRRIYEKLKQKGIAPGLAGEILSADAGNRDPFEDAMLLLERRARRIDSVEDPRKRNHRILCMLAGRGFTPDVACRALKAWAERER